MIVAEAHPRTYTRLCPGPRLDQAWTVVSGMVAVVGEAGTITLPPGATWPGVDALPDDWLDDLQPAEAIAAPGSQWETAAPEALVGGIALIHAHLLRIGPLSGRLARLDRSGAGHMNQTMQAALIGTRRETVTKVRGEMGRGG